MPKLWSMRKPLAEITTRLYAWYAVFSWEEDGLPSRVMRRRTLPASLEGWHDL